MNEFTCVVFISGTGSNLRAILEAIEKGALAGVKVAAVIADVDAPGLSFARDRGLPAHVVPLADYSTREDWNRALVDSKPSGGASSPLTRRSFPLSRAPTGCATPSTTA